MSRDKQIEEMAKFVCNACEMGGGFDGECANGNDYKKCGISRETAEAMYNANYRQIPEGAIVLTRAEIDALTQYNEKVKRQYAREIFAEFGKLTCTNEEDYRIFAELKKKYIGKDTNVTTKYTEEGK